MKLNIQPLTRYRIKTNSLGEGSHQGVYSGNFYFWQGEYAYIEIKWSQELVTLSVKYNLWSLSGYKT